MTAEVDPTPTEPASIGSRRSGGRFLLLLRAVPDLGTYVGVALIVTGGALLVLAWGRVAGVTNVGLQTPYIISAACVGLAFVAVGLTVISIAAKAADSRARRAQLAELADLLRAIREALEDPR